MATQGRTRDDGALSDFGPRPNYSLLGAFGNDYNSADGDEDVTEESDQSMIDQLHYSGSQSDSANSDGSMISDPGRLPREHILGPHLMGPPLLPTPRRSAPSPEPSQNLLHAGVCTESTKTGSLGLAIEQSHDRSKRLSHSDESSKATMNTAVGGHNSLIRNSSPALAAFEQRAGSRTSLSAYNRNHGNSNYTDLAERTLYDAHERRLQAMRIGDAKEYFHYRIPPEDAPLHMRMMVLLYQWAAWATEIVDSKRREEMIKWVNGRFLDFMMSGGHVPGYNLKELLEIAGVDPKELYAYSNAHDQQDSSIANMSSSQLAVTINNRRQPHEAEIELEAGGEEPSEPDSDHSNNVLDAPQKGPSPRSWKCQTNGDDKGGTNDTLHETASTNYESDLWNSGREPSTAAIVYEGAANIISDRKRETTLDFEDSDQVCHSSAFTIQRHLFNSTGFRFPNDKGWTLEL